MHTSLSSKYLDRPNGWNDEHFGLLDMEDRTWINGLPYAQRSRFDWLRCLNDGDSIVSDRSCTDSSDCWQYERCNYTSHLCEQFTYNYHNNVIYYRFFRILSEGPGTFASDGHNEDLGYTFTGVGDSLTYTIFNTASLCMQNPMALHSSDAVGATGWINCLQTAGATHSKSTEVNLSLDAIGFIYGEYGTGWLTTVTPRLAEFSQWPDSPKFFWVYKGQNNSNLYVYHYDSTRGGYVTDTIAANTANAPAVAEYNSRLYIFWRDQTNNAIKHAYYKSDRTYYGIYDDGAGRSLYTSGAFDATTFNGALTIAFLSGGTYYAAKCTSSYCQSSHWYDFGGGVYKKSLWIGGYQGLAIDAGDYVHGNTNPASSHLYVFSSAGGRLYIDQFDTSLTSTGVWTSIPDYYPSYAATANSVLGIKIARSAFSTAQNPMNYIYLAWIGNGTNDIYNSIVFNFDNSFNDQFWITRSVKAYIKAANGVTIQKQNGVAERIRYAYVGGPFYEQYYYALRYMKY